VERCGPDALTEDLSRIVRDDPDLMELLRQLRGCDLPQWRLVSGCIYQTVWNVLTGRARGYGIKDYDVCYFDGSDLSWEAEDVVIKRVAHPRLAVEVRNQARVHLWFEKHFGFPIAPLASVEDAIDNYCAITHLVGLRLLDDDSLDIYAPGLADIFAMRLRPNPRNANCETYLRKNARMTALWPELAVEPWPDMPTPV
jgi:hypothetical protein